MTNTQPKSIAFTGTQQGMTEEQRNSLSSVLSNFTRGDAVFRHGDCIGADAQAHALAVEQEFTIVLHPPLNPAKRAHCKAHNQREPLPYLKRNLEMVKACDVLIATPRTNMEELRSGTWATVRYARQMDKPIIIIWPTGDVDDDLIRQLIKH